MARKPNTSPQTRSLFEVFLADAPAWRYGYDLSRLTGIKSGTLYPILMRLEASGLLEAQWESAPAAGKPPRHMYRLSASGMTEAAESLQGRQGPVPAAEIRIRTEKAT
jgi:DNA-binding PadR family transcriptional regulator